MQGSTYFILADRGMQFHKMTMVTSSKFPISISRKKAILMWLGLSFLGWLEAARLKVSSADGEISGLADISRSRCSNRHPGSKAACSWSVMFSSSSSAVSKTPYFLGETWNLLSVSRIQWMQCLRLTLLNSNQIKDLTASVAPIFGPSCTHY